MTHTEAVATIEPMLRAMGAVEVDVTVTHRAPFDPMYPWVGPPQWIASVEMRPNIGHVGSGGGRTESDALAMLCANARHVLIGRADEYSKEGRRQLDRHDAAMKALGPQ